MRIHPIRMKKAASRPPFVVSFDLKLSRLVFH
jgi:hypothetical protein